METPSHPDNAAASSSNSAEVDQRQIHAPNEIPKEDMGSLSPDEHVAYKLNKARHLRRLRERWRCKTTGHVYCFTDSDAPHVELNDEDMHIWASLIHDGYATLLIVPERISGKKHTTSVDSMTMNTVTFQRAFHFKTNPSLSDLRSLRNRISSDRSSLVSSASSSFVAGIGSMSGKGILWVGEKILDAIMTIEPRRQIWIMKKAVKRIDKLPPESQRQWILKNKSAMLRHVDHLLELSSDNYSAGKRASSFDLANSFSRSLWGNLANDRDWLSLFTLMNAKLYPLTSLRDEHGNISPLGVSLREVQLEEDTDIDIDNINYMFSCFVNCACGQLFQSNSPRLRQEALGYLNRLNEMTEGHRELDRLSKAGGFLEHMAERMFINVLEDHDEHATAVLFFTKFAQDHPAFRRYLLEPNGLPLLVKRFKIASTSLPAGINGCPAYAKCSTWALETASGYQWAVPTMLRLDICPYLVKSLLSHHFPSSGESQWDHYYLLGILSHLAVLGGEHGKGLVQAVVTPEVCNQLQHIKDEEWEYPWVAGNVRLYTSQLLKMIQIKSE